MEDYALRHLFFLTDYTFTFFQTGIILHLYNNWRDFLSKQS